MIAYKKSKMKERISQKSKKKESRMKKTLIVSDSIINHIAGWRLNKIMKSAVSVRSIPGATIKDMLHHVKSCLEDTSPDNIMLHHGTKVKANENQAFISDIVVRNDKLNKKGTEVNALLMGKCVTRLLLFIKNKNINLNMLNKS